MEAFTTSGRAAFIFITMIIVSLVDCQTNNACTGAMIRSFGPCINYLGSNSSSPTSACCNSLRQLMSTGEDCLCLIATGGVPFSIPNGNFVISLPRACKMSGVPIQCKASATPLPAPGPSSINLNPVSSPPSPPAPFLPQPLTPPPAAGADGGISPPLAPEGDIVPTLTPPGMRPTLLPSAARPSCRTVSPSLLLVLWGVILIKCYG